ncbi:hypothetical protein TNCV_2687361 [Trichonephila clavipes]|nr:hypothetical protein TNCV_2687361 [Trichonephila clavipes]
MGSEISRTMRDGLRKWEIVNPDDPDQVNGTKLLNCCIVIGPGQKKKQDLKTDRTSNRGVDQLKLKIPEKSSD